MQIFLRLTYASVHILQGIVYAVLVFKITSLVDGCIQCIGGVYPVLAAQIKVWS